MIGVGRRLDFGPGPIADKHCVGGVPGNQTTMIVVPILAALGVTMPKTSSRAITSPAGTADTMGVLAEVALAPDDLHRVVRDARACIAWGGALELAPADDNLITVERPMEIDTEPQMVASILGRRRPPEPPTSSSTSRRVEREGPVFRRGQAARGSLPRGRSGDRPQGRDGDHRGTRTDRAWHRT